jgi:dTDP-4-amino-4,6-dideoxygalactose transaminase
VSIFSPVAVAVAARLKVDFIPNVVYFAKPLHPKTADRDYPAAGSGFAGRGTVCRREVLSLPMHPYLDAATQDRIVDAVQAAS